MSHRIIIVDDHPLFRAALERTRDCDLVLLDLNLPGVRGFSGLLLLRAQFPDIPVMIVSAVEDVSVIRRCFDLGASGFLSKSESAARIRESIETILAGG